MRCSDCNKQFNYNLKEFSDGRRTLFLCDMCRAEREWRESDGKIPLPPKPSFWDLLKGLFRKK